MKAGILIGLESQCFYVFQRCVFSTAVDAFHEPVYKRDVRNVQDVV